MPATSTISPGCEGFPRGFAALAMSEDVTFAAGPVENFRGQTTHGLPSDRSRVSAGAPERAEYDDGQTDKSRSR